MSTFEAEGINFRKSSWSDTDWTKQCVGVHVAPASLTSALADSVTKDVITNVPGQELLALLATVK